MATNEYIGEQYELMPAGSSQNIPYSVNNLSVGSIDAHADPGLIIVDSNTGANLSTQTNLVLVGQQINLTCECASTNGPILSNFKWTVPGNVISNFYESSDPLTTNGFPVPLTNKTNFNISFYWIDGGSNAVQCTTTINGKSVTAKAYFQIKKPTADFSSEIEDPVQVINNDELIFGGNVFVGIGFFENNEDTSGEWKLIQIGSELFRYQDSSDGSWYRGQGSGLDGADPYPVAEETDNPSTTLDPGLSQVTGNGSFTMYLTFKPNLDNSIRIPIKQITWSWSGATTNNNGTWVMVTGNTNAQTIGISAPSTISWTNNISSTLHTIIKE